MSICAEQSRGRGNTHREVHLPQLGNPAICVHACVAFYYYLELLTSLDGGYILLGWGQ